MARIIRGLKFSSEFRKDPHSSNINLNKVLYDLQKYQIIYSNGLLIIIWMQTQKSHIFLRTQHKKFKLTLVKLPSPTVNVKSFWVSILIINWHGNLQKLLIEIFKIKIKLPPEIMNEVFDFIECWYRHRNKLRFKSRNIHM